jgi:hypothetical protein
VISAAAIAPFKTNAVRKVLVDAVVAPLRLDLGPDESLYIGEVNETYIRDCGCYGDVMVEERMKKGVERVVGW